MYSPVALSFMNGKADAHKALDLKDMIKNIIRSLVMSGNTELGAAFWFLKTLFGISILFFVIDYLLYLIVKKEHIKDIFHSVIAVLFLLCGWFCSTKEIMTMGIPIILYSYSLYLLGYMNKRYSIMTKLSNIWSGLIALVVLILATIFGPAISVGNNNYWHTWYLILCSFAGWILYTIVGIGIPVVLDILWKKMKKSLIGKKTRVINIKLGLQTY